MINKPTLPYSYVVIEGNIGAGKTSLASILANIFNTDIVLESFAENTFLPQFYEQPERFAFPLEMSFLAERYQQILKAQQEVLENGKNLIGDYLFEKSSLFAGVNLKGPELQLFRRFLELIQPGLKKPDLLVYLHKSTPQLIKNIRKRGREYEQNIAADYLDSLSKAYLDYLHNINNQRIIILDSDNLDFVESPEHLRYMIDLVKKEHPVELQSIKFER